MLPIEQIITFIRHKDPLLVKLAFDCLKSVRWPGRLTGDFVLEEIQKGHASLRNHLQAFETTPAVLKYAVAAIRSRSIDANEFWPFGVIDRSRDKLFTPEIVEEIRGLQLDVGWVADAIRLRLELMSLPTDQLREELLIECCKADEDRSAMSEQKRIRALADRLVFRGDSIEWAHEQLAQTSGSDGWSEVWLYALLIKANDLSVLPKAAERFRTVNPDNNESLFLELQTAMAELATPTDIGLLTATWEHCVEDQRGGVVEAISKLRFPEAEPLLLRIARESGDETNRTHAAVGLCEMLATNEESIEFVRDLTERGDFDTTFASLEELAIPLGIVLGRPFSEEAQWRLRLNDPDEQARRRMRFLGGEDSPLATLAKSLGTLKPASLPVANAEAMSLPRVSDRIRLLERNRSVGRNDPCPCRSGKKYKKCCGK